MIEDAHEMCSREQSLSGNWEHLFLAFDGVII